MDTNSTVQIDAIRHYGVKEAAEILHLSDDDVYRFLEGGELKGRRTGGRGKWRIPGQSILDFRFVDGAKQEGE